MVKKVNASHILVKSEEMANAIAYMLSQGNDFATLAKERSICPSAKKGGQLGWFTRGKMVREFENAAFSLKKGEVSKPVKTQFGWHIIKINDTE